MDSFLELEATKRALDLVAEVYRVCKKLPKEEVYGLSSQLKRSSSSIVANIAEGFGRYTYADKANRYTIARGECTEVVAYLHVAVRVQLLTFEDIQQGLLLADQTGKLISGLIVFCRKKASTANS
ncbi:MAG: four helix bundle protein [Candidatus Peribacteraceae bacterium]|nr:four helix bundle protein [Candidatus Peribacteraceae bacterium]MDD5742519.1 four helix bundle protein [Candidatus Peribacteraceae bacterium]